MQAVQSFLKNQQPAAFGLKYLKTKIRYAHVLKGRKQKISCKKRNFEVKKQEANCEWQISS